MLFNVLITLSALSVGVLAAGSSSASVASASASGSHASGSSAASQTAPASQSTVFTVSGLSPITVSSGDVKPVLSAIEANSAKVASAVGTSSLFALEASLLLEEGKQAVGTQTSLTAYITTATGGAPSLVVGKKNTAQGLAVPKGLVAGAATAVGALAVGAAMIF